MVSALSSHALGESCKRALQHECSHALSEAATLEGAVEGEHGQSAGEASSNTTQRVKSSEMFAEDDAALDDLLRELEDVEESDQSPQPHLEGVTLSRVTSGGSAAHRHLYGADQALLLLDRLPSSERLPQEVIDSVDCVLRREASGTQKTVPYREMRRILKMLKEEHLQEQRMAKSGCACFPIWFRKSQPVHPKPVVSHTPSANKTRHGDIVLKQLEDPEPERRPGPARSGSSSSPSGSSVSKPPVDREESLQLAKHAMQQSVKQMCDAGEDIAVTPLREILDKQATETHRAPATSGEVLQLLLKLKNEPDPRAKMQAVVLADAALTDSSRHSKALSASSRADRLVRGELRRSAHLQLLRPVTPEEAAAAVHAPVRHSYDNFSLGAYQHASLGQDAIFGPTHAAGRRTRDAEILASPDRSLRGRRTADDSGRSRGSASSGSSRLSTDRESTSPDVSFRGGRERAGHGGCPVGVGIGFGSPLPRQRLNW